MEIKISRKMLFGIVNDYEFFIESFDKENRIFLPLSMKRRKNKLIKLLKESGATIEILTKHK
jgi:hypothetical protein